MPVTNLLDTGWEKKNPNMIQILEHLLLII